MQCFHGSIDTTLNPQNLQEEIKEWTTVLGLSASPVETLVDNPMVGWTTWVYGASFTATLAQNVTHNIQPIESLVLAWFDLTCTGTNCFSRPSGGSSSSGITLTTNVVAPTRSVPSTSSTANPGGLVAKFGQCGGINFLGATSCVSGTTCTVQNPFYSQCL
jgi:hypothetical protein